MTYENIIEGLKHCSNPQLPCIGCSYFKSDTDSLNCHNVLMQDALALIEQQSALIAQLQKIQDMYFDEIMED